ncbi:LysR family transcriptional regulator [Rhodospirillum centenum]|uniref:Transcriptional regulator, LysR family protein n=1 Tax=Rhodospirillum centenum (strain ATCC 51521 / SW) TaxID=414684 RepID=B6IRI3_RHOCS|nr:LysR family transcriptional regulator [Rhodospirillum centenum]ACI98069.1 transcriptional regulator, LysR family protein [Rhodospirillum centenum SW]
MDWDKLRVFHAVAEAGSFTHAGETLNLSQSAVSRQISALEESLHVPLFHRHARGLILTEQGELLYRTAREVFAKLSMTEAMLSESKEHPKGPLKVTTTMAFGSTWLTPRVREFLSLYPDVQLSLLLDDTELDLSMREADIAIRMSAPRQPDLIQRHLMTVRVHIYAHRAYAEKRGLPQSLDELDHHDIIAYPGETRAPVSNINWLLHVGDPPGGERQTVLRVNSLYAMYRAVESGLGIASLPDYVVDGNPDIVRVLPDVSGPRIDAYFVYAEELRHSKRIAVFRDFLVRKVQETFPASHAVGA